MERNRNRNREETRSDKLIKVVAYSLVACLAAIFWVGIFDNSNDVPPAYNGEQAHFDNHSHTGTERLASRVRIEDEGYRSIGSGAYARVKGVVHNDNPFAVRVQIQISAWDHQGRFITEQRYFPAGTGAIPAESTWPFDTVLQVRDGTYSNITMKIIEVEQSR